MDKISKLPRVPLDKIYGCLSRWNAEEMLVKTVSRSWLNYVLLTTLLLHCTNAVQGYKGPISYLESSC